MTQQTHVREAEQDFTPGQLAVTLPLRQVYLPLLVIAGALIWLCAYVMLTVQDLKPVLQQAVEDVRQGRQEVQRIREALGPFVPTERPR